MGWCGSLAVGLWVLVLGVLPSFASAALIEWDFEGVVALRETGGTPAGVPALEAALSSLGAVEGAPMSGFVILDTTTPNIHPPGGDVANYVNAVVDAEVFVGNLHLSFDINGPFSTQFAVGTYPNGFMALGPPMVDPSGLLTVATVLGVGPESFDLAAFQTVAFPEYPPPLESLIPFGENPNTSGGFGSEIYVGGCVDDPRACVTFHGAFTRLERVPEPPQWTLLGVAGAGLLALRRRVNQSFKVRIASLAGLASAATIA